MNQRTKLYDEHVRLNAKMVPFSGWEMPVQYTSLKSEAEAVRNNVGVFDVSHMGEFWVTGPDTVKFVDYLVTNDIESSELGKAIYSPLCRENGTIIDDLIVYKLAPQKILICVNAGNIKKDWDWIFDQSKKFNVKVTNDSENYSLLALQGPKAEEIMTKLSIISAGENFPYYSAKEANFQGASLVIARTGYTGEDGFEIFGSHESIKSLWTKFISMGVTPCGLGARDVLRLEVCYPLYGHELTDEVTPLDSGLKWTVKLSKPNFIGKSSLENYKPKFQLVKLLLEKAIPRQDYLVEDDQGKVIGKITSGTMSVAKNQGIALAHIQTNLYPKNENFIIVIRDKKYPATKTQKPFVTGGHK